MAKVTQILVCFLALAALPSGARAQVVDHFMRAGAPVDVAVAASYLRSADEPLRLIAPFVAAYHERVPLSDAELQLLHLLIRTRVATTVTMCHWRAASFAENDDYLQFSLATEGDADECLRALDTIGPADFLQKLKKHI